MTKRQRARRKSTAINWAVNIGVILILVAAALLFPAAASRKPRVPAPAPEIVPVGPIAPVESTPTPSIDRSWLHQYDV